MDAKNLSWDAINCHGMPKTVTGCQKPVVGCHKLGTLYWVHCTECTVYRVQCTGYSVLGTLYRVQYTGYSVPSTV
jgi:hypothetical protein